MQTGVMVATEHADVILRDGGTLRLRPPAAGDADALLAFFGGLSQRSLYLRYHGLPEVGPRLVGSLLEPDWQERGVLLGALVEEDGERVVAVANYVRLRDPKLAEAAFAVADEHQGRGIGMRLLEQLAARAAEVGIDRFVAYVLPDNRAMLGVFGSAGFELTRELEGGEVEVQFPIAPDRELPRACRRARPRGGCRLTRAVLPAPERGSHRRLQAPRIDRRRAVPQHPRRRLRGCRISRQSRRRACGRRARLRLDRGDPGRGRSRRDHTSGARLFSVRRSRHCTRACVPSS